MEVCNQRVKEETFIQTGKRGEKLGWRGHEAMQQHTGGGVRQWLVDRISHIQMQISQEKQLGSKTNHSIQGFSMGK